MPKSMKLVFLLLQFVFSGFGFEEKVGNPDDTAKIERPCTTYDLNCIRAYFEKHAHCKKTFGPVPDPLTRPQANYYIPRVNLTITIPEQKVGGLNGRVEEFYINRATDKLVIAVEFRNLSETADNVYYKYHRRGREPIVTRAAATNNLGSNIITAVIPNLDDLQLHEAECTAFSNPAIPFILLSPTIVESTDPQPLLTNAAFSANLPNNFQEFFLTGAPYFISTYIQYNICDFGLFLT